MKRRVELVLTVVLVAALVTGCGQGDSAKPGNLTVGNAEGFPVTLTDVTGKEVVIKSPPQRIIPIAPSNTEILFALGLGDRVVAVTDNDDYPPAARDKEKIGGFTVNAEKIVSLEPDLVVAMQSVNLGQIDELRKMGLPVLVVEAQTIDAIYQSIRTIAQATGTSARGDELIATMQSRLDEVQKKLAAVPAHKRKRVFVEIGTEPLYTVGEGSLQHEIIKLAGGVNIVEEKSPWLQYSPEKVVEQNPDAIILAVHGQNVSARPGWDYITAVKQGMVMENLDINTMVRPTNRITQAVEDIARFLYPELF